MILYINTSGKYCEIALFHEQNVVDTARHQDEMSHSTHLHDLVESILQRNKLDFKNLSALAVLNGPGSYTGLRIGLAAAKGFCFALDVPLVLFNQLSLLCDVEKSLQPNCTALAAIEYAREGECFFEARFYDNAILNILPSVQTTDFIENVIAEHPSLRLVSSEPSRVNCTNVMINQAAIPLTFISKAVHEKINSGKVDSLFHSEPFYLKKVHANTPKKRF